MNADVALRFEQGGKKFRPIPGPGRGLDRDEAEVRSLISAPPRR